MTFGAWIALAVMAVFWWAAARQALRPRRPREPVEEAYRTEHDGTTIYRPERLVAGGSLEKAR